jgi:1-deoxy-D-xylulose-5-phosphate synthase
VLHFTAWDGLLDRGLKIRTLTLPDRFIEQDAPERMYESAGLDANSIVATALSTLGRGHDAAAMIA